MRSLSKPKQLNLVMILLKFASRPNFCDRVCLPRVNVFDHRLYFTHNTINNSAGQLIKAIELACPLIKND